MVPFQLLRDPHTRPPMRRSLQSRAASLRRRLPYLLRRRYPFSSEPLETPLFIVTAGRSGSTLLRRILIAHGIHIPPEMRILPRLINDFRMTRYLPWPVVTSTILGRIEYWNGFQWFHLPTLRPLARELTTTPEPRRSLATILTSFYRFHGEHTHGRPVSHWGDKTPINVFHLPHIHRLYPHAQYIHVLRDGCDVAESFLRIDHPTTTSLDAAANRWLDAVNDFRRFESKHPDRCLEIRYEDLVQDTERSVLMACRFLGISFDQKAIHQTRGIVDRMGDVERPHLHRVRNPSISNASLGQSRRRLTHRERARLQQLLGAELARLGYEPCD